jgi:FkbM family methyltransferase
MEAVPKSCNIFWDGTGTRNPCLEYSEGRSYEPDPHNREAIATVLHHCHTNSGTSCLSLDIGANIGMMSVMMALMGSRVIAVEPQLELSQAFAKTIAVNNWKGLVHIEAGFATMGPAGESMLCDGGYRFGNPNRPHITWNAPKISIPDIVSSLPAKYNTNHFDLVKIDTDSVDGEMLDGLIALIKSKKCSVKSIITEFSGGTTQMLVDFQALGYHIYRLNVHMLQRFFDSRGVDIINHFQPINIPDGYEERYFLSYMKYALKMKPNLTAKQMEPLITNPVCEGGCTQFLITQLDLEPTTMEHSSDIHRRKELNIPSNP